LSFIKSTDDSISITHAVDEPAYPAAGYAWYVVIIRYLSYAFSMIDGAIIQYLVKPIRIKQEICIESNHALFPGTGA
jgi:hypothetical protein